MTTAALYAVLALAAIAVFCALYAWLDWPPQGKRAPVDDGSP